MKHQLSVTFYLILLFVIAQLVGLHIVSQYIDTGATASSGATVLHSEQYIIEPPQVQNESWSWLPIMLAVLIGTALVLLLAKFKKFGLWKLWYSFSIFITLSLALAPYLAGFIIYLGGTRSIGFLGVALLAGLLTYRKVQHSGVFIHNFTEVLIYGGMAALLVPILNITACLILLLLIALYDAYAVWHSKHMITLANFQTESHMFAGLIVPKGTSSIKKLKVTTQEHGTESHAILGGGDIAFPLLFAGAILKTTNSFPLALLIVIGATGGLSILLTFSKKGKFYPAMPFISGGCFIAYGLVFLLL